MALQTTGLRWINEGLSSFLSGVNAASNGIKSFYSETGRSLGHLTGFTSSVGHAATAIDYLIRRVILLTAAYAAIGAIKGWISTGFEQLALLDQLNKSTQALVATQLVESGAAKNFNDALAQGAQKASELFEWDKKLAVVSIFTTEQITELQQMAMAVGINADQAKILVADFTTWGTVANRPFEMVKGGLKAVTDMFAKQKVQAEEMTRQLTNAGIPAWQFLADALHVTVAKAQEMVTQGLVPANFAMAAIADRMGSTYGPALKNFAFSWAGLTSSMTDLKNLGLANFFQGVADAFKPFAERFVSVMMQPETMNRIREWGVALGEVAGKLFGFAEAAIASGDPIGFLAIAINNVIPGFYNLYQAVVNMAGMFTRLAGAAFGWGSGIGSSFADGIIASATYIIQAITYIGNIIAYWLSPGSPPKVAPDLTKWGTQAAQEWYKGWTQADGRELKDMIGTIKDALENLVSGGTLPEEGVIPKLLGGKDILAQATQQIEEFGNVSSDVLSQIDSWASSASPEIQRLVDSYLEWEKASKAVKDAQEELNKINEEFEARLAPINDALKKNQAEQAKIRDQERIASLQEKIAEGKGTPEQLRLYALEIEQIQIEANIRTQKEAAENDMASAQNVAKAKLEAAKKQEETAKTAYESAQAQIQLQTEHNRLLQQQTSLLDKIAKQEEAAAKKAAGGGGGGGGAKLKAPGLPEGAGGPLDLKTGIFGDINDALADFNAKAAEARQHWDELKKRFLDAKAAAEQTAGSFKPLSDLAGGIGLAFGSLAAGGIITFVLNLVKSISPIGALIFAGTMLYKGWTENWLGIRDIVIPIIDTVAEKIEFFVTGFQRWMSGMESSQTFLQSLGFSPEVAQTVSDVASVISEAFTFISTGIERVVSGQESIGTFFKSIAEYIGIPKDAILVFEDIIADLYDFAVSVFVDLSNFFNNNGSKMSSDILDTWNLIKETIGNALTLIYDLVVGIFFVIQAVIKDNHISLELILKGAWDTIIGIIRGALNLINGIIKTVLSIINGDWSGAWENIKSLSANFVKDLISIVTGFLNFIAGFFGTKLDDLADLWKSNWKKMGDLLGIAFDNITKIVLDFLYNTFTKPFDDITTELFEVGQNIVNAIKNGIASKWQSFLDWIHEKIMQIPKAVRDFLGIGSDSKVFLEIGRNIVGGLSSGLVSGYTSVGDAIGGFLVILTNAQESFANIVWKPGFAEDMQNALQQATKDAEDFIEKMAQLNLSSQIGGFDTIISSLQTVRDLWKDIEGLNKSSSDALSNSVKLTEEANKLLSEGKTEEANAKFAEADLAREKAEDLASQARNRQALADRRESELERARQEYLKNAATDPENAQKLFNLKSKQINDLASLDQQISDSKDDRTRQSLLNERNFLVQQQAIELQLFQRQAAQRNETITEEIQKIVKEFSDVFTSEHIDTIDNWTEAYQKLFNTLSSFTTLQLPPWLTPGSPTPLENALVGITRSMKELSSNVMPSFSGSLKRMNAVASAGQIFNNSTKSYYSRTNNYNLGVTTNQSPQAAFQSFELMRSIYA